MPFTLLKDLGFESDQCVGDQLSFHLFTFATRPDGFEPKSTNSSQTSLVTRDLLNKGSIFVIFGYLTVIKNRIVQFYEDILERIPRQEIEEYKELFLSVAKSVAKNVAKFRGRPTCSELTDSPASRPPTPYKRYPPHRSRLRPVFGA